MRYVLLALDQVMRRGRRYVHGHMPGRRAVVKGMGLFVLDVEVDEANGWQQLETTSTNALTIVHCKQDKSSSRRWLRGHSVYRRDTRGRIVESPVVENLC